MASITFNSGTLIPSTWLNDVNTTTYTTVPAIVVKTNFLGVTGNTLVINTTESLKLPVGTPQGAIGLPLQLNAPQLQSLLTSYVVERFIYRARPEN